MTITKVKPKFECFGCKRNIEKNQFKSKTIQQAKAFECQMCWYYNAPWIFNKK